MKGHPEQTHLAARRDLAADIEKRGGKHSAVLNDLDLPALLHHKQTATGVARLFQAQRRAQAGNQRRQRQGWKIGGRHGAVATASSNQKNQNQQSGGQHTHSCHSLHLAKKLGSTMIFRLPVVYREKPASRYTEGQGRINWSIEAVAGSGT